MSERKPDKKLIEQLKKGHIYLEDPKDVAPKKENKDQKFGGGGGTNG